MFSDGRWKEYDSEYTGSTVPLLLSRAKLIHFCHWKIFELRHIFEAATRWNRETYARLARRSKSTIPLIKRETVFTNAIIAQKIAGSDKSRREAEQIIGFVLPKIKLICKIKIKYFDCNKHPFPVSYFKKKSLRKYIGPQNIVYTPWIFTQLDRVSVTFLTPDISL